MSNFTPPYKPYPEYETNTKPIKFSAWGSFRVTNIIGYAKFGVQAESIIGTPTNYTAVDPDFDKVQILLHFSGPRKSKQIVDVKGHMPSGLKSVQLETGGPLVGRGSVVRFDGADNGGIDISTNNRNNTSSSFSLHQEVPWITRDSHVDWCFETYLGNFATPEDIVTATAAATKYVTKVLADAEQVKVAALQVASIARTTGLAAALDVMDAEVLSHQATYNAAVLTAAAIRDATLNLDTDPILVELAHVTYTQTIAEALNTQTVSDEASAETHDSSAAAIETTYSIDANAANASYRTIELANTIPLKTESLLQYTTLPAMFDWGGYIAANTRSNNSSTFGEGGVDWGISLSSSGIHVTLGPSTYDFSVSEEIKNASPWAFLRVTRRSDTLRCWLGEVLLGSYSNVDVSTDRGATFFRVGRGDAKHTIRGYLDELRFTIGSARPNEDGLPLLYPYPHRRDSESRPRIEFNCNAPISKVSTKSSTDTGDSSGNTSVVAGSYTMTISPVVIPQFGFLLVAIPQADIPIRIPGIRVSLQVRRDKERSISIRVPPCKFLFRVTKDKDLDFSLRSTLPELKITMGLYGRRGLHIATYMPGVHIYLVCGARVPIISNTTLVLGPRVDISPIPIMMSI